MFGRNSSETEILLWLLGKWNVNMRLTKVILVWNLELIFMSTLGLETWDQTNIYFWEEYDPSITCVRQSTPFETCEVFYMYVYYGQ
jgi:hypothetical protein